MTTDYLVEETLRGELDEVRSSVNVDDVMAGGARRARRRNAARAGGAVLGTASVIGGLVLGQTFAGHPDSSPAPGGQIAGCTTAPQTCDASMVAGWAREHLDYDTRQTAFTPAKEAPGHYLLRAEKPGAKDDRAETLEVMVGAPGNGTLGFSSDSKGGWDERKVSLPRAGVAAVVYSSKRLNKVAFFETWIVQPADGRGTVMVTSEVANGDRPKGLNDAAVRELLLNMVGTAGAPARLAGCTLKPSTCDARIPQAWANKHLGWAGPAELAGDDMFHGQEPTKEGRTWETHGPSGQAVGRDYIDWIGDVRVSIAPTRTWKDIPEEPAPVSSMLTTRSGLKVRLIEYQQGSVTSKEWVLDDGQGHGSVWVSFRNQEKKPALTNAQVLELIDQLATGSPAPATSATPAPTTPAVVGGPSTGCSPALANCSGVVVKDWGRNVGLREVTGDFKQVRTLGGMPAGSYVYNADSFVPGPDRIQSPEILVAPAVGSSVYWNPAEIHKLREPGSPAGTWTHRNVDLGDGRTAVAYLQSFKDSKTQVWVVREAPGHAAIRVQIPMLGPAEVSDANMKKLIHALSPTG